MRNLLILIVILQFFNCKRQTSKNVNSNIIKGEIKNGIDSIINKKDKILEIQYWNSGNLDSITKYDFKNNLVGKGIVKDNFLEFYNKSGNKEYEGFLKNGKLNGSVRYFEGNNLVGSLNYKDGIKDGYSFYFNDSIHTLRMITKFTEGKAKDGLLMLFNEKGTLKSLNKVGLEKEGTQSLDFYENGVVKSIGTLNDSGGYEGWVFYFNKEGEMEKKTLYKNANSIEEINFSK